MCVIVSVCVFFKYILNLRCVYLNIKVINRKAKPFIKDELRWAHISQRVPPCSVEPRRQFELRNIWLFDMECQLQTFEGHPLVSGFSTIVAVRRHAKHLMSVHIWSKPGATTDLDVYNA